MQIWTFSKKSHSKLFSLFVMTQDNKDLYNRTGAYWKISMVTRAAGGLGN